MGHTRPFLRSHGLSDQQWRVLRVLGNGEALETGKVAQKAFLLGPSLTGVLSRMERDGLIERQKDPTDQRRSVVSATSQGLALAGGLAPDQWRRYRRQAGTAGNPDRARRLGRAGAWTGG